MKVASRIFFLRFMGGTSLITRPQAAKRLTSLPVGRCGSDYSLAGRLDTVESRRKSQFFDISTRYVSGRAAQLPLRVDDCAVAPMNAARYGPVRRHRVRREDHITVAAEPRCDTSQSPRAHMRRTQVRIGPANAGRHRSPAADGDEGVAREVA